MDYSLVLCVVQIILLFLVLFPLATHKCSIIEKKMHSASNFYSLAYMGVLYLISDVDPDEAFIVYNHFIACVNIRLFDFGYLDGGCSSEIKNKIIRINRFVIVLFVNYAAMRQARDKKCRSRYACIIRYFIKHLSYSLVSLLIYAVAQRVIYNSRVHQRKHHNRTHYGGGERHIHALVSLDLRQVNYRNIEKKRCHSEGILLAEVALIIVV